MKIKDRSILKTLDLQPKESNRIYTESKSHTNGVIKRKTHYRSLYVKINRLVE